MVIVLVSSAFLFLLHSKDTGCSLGQDKSSCFSALKMRDLRPQSCQTHSWKNLPLSLTLPPPPSCLSQVWSTNNCCSYPFYFTHSKMLLAKCKSCPPTSLFASLTAQSMLQSRIDLNPKSSLIWGRMSFQGPWPTHACMPTYNTLKATCAGRIK